METEKLLYEGLNKNGYDINSKQIEKLIYYMKRVLIENKKFNLTAINDEREFVTKHLIDSILMYDDTKEALIVADVGTGGGFPGIPLKIIHPEWKMTFIDATEKKLRFIENTCSELEIKDVDFIHSRAEDVGKDKKHREKYDLVFSRAVASMNILCEYCLPLVKIGGKFIAAKGPRYKEEIEEATNAIEVLGGKLESIIQKDIPFDDIARYLVVCEKIKSTPSKYPRRQGVPTKKPL